MVHAATLPMHPLARDAGERALALALHGGEDYELLFAARASVSMPKRVGGVGVHCIGHFTTAKEVRLESEGRTEPLRSGGWEHTV